MGFADKRGQLTIFIIIAIILVAAIAFFFIFKPRFGSISIETNPKAYLIECLSPSIKDSVDLLSKRGGSLEPENFFKYRGENIDYLCYTNEYYKTCVMQQPMLKQHISSQLNELLRPKARECLASLKSEFEKRGYTVTTARQGDLSTELTDGKIILNIDSALAISKPGEATQNFESLSVEYKSNLYNLVMMTLMILNWEARYGDSDILTFMMSYPDFIIYKLKQLDGTKVYTIKSRDTKEQFVFATRSLSWPGGFVLNERVK